MYSKTTHNVKVSVVPSYTRESSSPESKRYVWAYSVVIQNSSNRAIQLLSRYWQVIDAEGFIQEVKGKGVIGQQPVIASRSKFEYRSQVHLGSPSGIMLGIYHMVVPKTGEKIDIDIPAFPLDVPDLQIVLH